MLLLPRLVQRAGDELLPRAALAGDEDAARRRADAGDEVAHALNALAVADDGRPRLLRHLPAEVGQLTAKLPLLDAAPDLLKEVLGEHRLEDVVDRPGAKRSHRRLHRGVRGEDDRGRVGTEPGHVREKLDAAHARHDQVAEDHVGRLHGQAAQRLLGVAGGLAYVALLPQQVGHVLAEDCFVVDKKDFGAHMSS